MAFCKKHRWHFEDVPGRSPSAARFIVCRVNSYRLFWWWGLTGGSHMGLLPIGKYTRSWRTASRVSTCRQDGPHRVARYYARNVCTHTETKKSSFTQSGTSKHCMKFWGWEGGRAVGC